MIHVSILSLDIMIQKNLYRKGDKKLKEDEKQKI